jgi:hypothetical protein
MVGTMRGTYSRPGSGMTPFECYVKYLALKQHFTRANYDYFKYHGRVKASEQSFETRKDKYFFYKLAKHPDATNFLLANMVSGSEFWIGDMREDSAEENYRNWKKRQESLSYIFKQDLTRLDQDFNTNFEIEKYGHPLLLRLYLRQEICIETMIILDMLVGYSASWEKELKKDLTWQAKYTIITKYRPFLSIKLDKMKSITLDYFTL